MNPLPHKVLGLDYPPNTISSSNDKNYNVINPLPEIFTNEVVAFLERQELLTKAQWFPTKTRKEDEFFSKSRERLEQVVPTIRWSTPDNH